MQSARVMVEGEESWAMVRWAASFLRERLASSGYCVFGGKDEPAGPDGCDLAIAIALAEGGSAPGRDWDEASARLESFEISVHRSSRGTSVEATGFGPRGAMYAIWEVLDHLGPDGRLADLKEGPHRPHVSLRASKLNLPWAPYRAGSFMALHDETCRSRNFWRGYIDMLARNRFNALTLWSLHPYPWMVRVRGFEYACGLSDAELAEWRDLWKFIFRHAKERGLDTYMITWNIFVSEEFAAHEGVDFSDREYHIGAGDTREVVAEYNRRCITQMIDEYEDLSGFGTSLGERMENLTPQERQRWIDEVVIRAMKDAKRRVKFVQRAPFTSDPLEIRESLNRADLDTSIWVEYKFNWSHGHSTPGLCMTHDTGAWGAGRVDDRYWNPPPDNYRMAWMVRNEDFFILRWGGPEFVREHVRRNTNAVSGGYFVGSEGMIPAKDLSHRRPHRHLTWDFLFQKQWLFYAVWGNLMYDPEASDDLFAKMFAARYGASVGPKMIEAWDRASTMALRFASYYRATWDHTLYSEGFLAPFTAGGPTDGSTPPFVTLERLISRQTLDPAYLSIAEFVQRERDGVAAPPKITPLELAAVCRNDGDRVIELVAHLRAERVRDRDTFDSELDDLLTWARLLRYFAAKLAAGVELCRYCELGRASDKQAAVGRIEEAQSEWEQICALTAPRYQHLPYIERRDTGFALSFSWSDYLDDVRREVDIVRRSQSTPR
ncbi:MAG TPA: hypothetical protein VMV68_11160 [Spirochaetia bacterium]|nr:hypothetical protein [Spirochaetia bacterium]